MALIQLPMIVFDDEVTSSPSALDLIRKIWPPP